MDLPIVKQIVEMMGGRIGAESLPEGRGRFTAALNLRLQEEAEVKPSAGVSSSVQRRVLVVEDNDLNREIAADLLEDAGFLVDTAVNGAEAVEKV